MNLKIATPLAQQVLPVGIPTVTALPFGKFLCVRCTSARNKNTTWLFSFGQ